MDILIGLMLLFAVFYVLHKAEGQRDADCPRGRCNDGRCPWFGLDRCPEQPCPGVSLGRCEGSLACLPSPRYCPSDHCATILGLTCADGTCVSIHEYRCQDGSIGCFQFQKRCQDGHCIRKSQYCPEEPCPANVPFKCDDNCKPWSAVCDGIKQCTSGADELNCKTITNKTVASTTQVTTTMTAFSTTVTTSPKPTTRFSEYFWPISIGLGVFAFMIISAYCRISKRNKNQGAVQEVDNVDTTTIPSRNLYRLVERPRQTRDQIQQQHIWSTTSDQLPSDNWTFHENCTGSGRPRERASNLSFHNLPPLSDDLSDILPSDLPIDSSSGIPYICPSNMPSNLHSLDLPPSYSEAMAHPNLYPATKPPEPAQLIQNTRTRTGRKNRPIVLPFTPLHL